jgi:formylglycine-generating enzyme required for sulfatase activity
VTSTVHAVTIETVPIGNPGNPAATQFSFGYYSIGAVAYSFNIGKTEVTNAQYAEFLNTVAAADAFDLYNTNMASDTRGGIVRSGDPGNFAYAVKDPALDGAYTYGNKPVVWVSFSDAMRFTNWLHNGQPTGPQNASTTEDGAYPLNGATTGAELAAVTRAAGARWWLPSQHEWFKAAYHKNDGVTGNYWGFPTRTDDAPNNNLPPGDTGNSANYLLATGDLDYPLTDAGAYTLSQSPYGTFDQGGNVWEWNDTISNSPDRWARGGGWNFLSSSFGLHANNQGLQLMPAESNYIGFRVAEVIPEPSTLVLAAAGLGMILARRRRYAKLHRLLLLTIVSCSIDASNAARAVTIETVPIGNPGNAADTRYIDTYHQNGTGAVSYLFRIGKTEVTNVQYMEFLNSVAASDPYSLYDTQMASESMGGITRSGASGSFTYAVKPPALSGTYTYNNKPVVFVNAGDVLRFTNWLHNGQPTGAQDSSTTEDGAYTLNGATTNAALDAVTRNSGARWWLPNEDEWYKAAYHKNDGTTANYWDFPTSTNDVPNNNPPSGDTGNSANFVDNVFTTGNSSYPMTDAGAYVLSASSYSTFDQAGNVYEWNERQFDGSQRGMRGGCWGCSTDLTLRAEEWFVADAEFADRFLGFRVASAIPEPSTQLLFAIVGTGLLWRRRRLPCVCLLVGVVGIFFSDRAGADTFGSGANTFDIEFVTIGNPGNAADTTGNPIPAGKVDYTYRVGKFEISEQMIEKANGLGGLGITKEIRGADKPATAVSWNEAARFVNWLNTSTGSPPAYKFDIQPGEAGYSANANIELWTISDPGYNPNNLYRNSLARYFLPSAHEWYKAAYYEPISGVYYDYPTASDNAPTPVVSGTMAGTAVYNQLSRQALPISRSPGV